MFLRRGRRDVRLRIGNDTLTAVACAQHALSPSRHHRCGYDNRRGAMKENPLDRQLEALRQELQAVAPPESVARAIAAAARGARSRSFRAARPGWRERGIA